MISAFFAKLIAKFGSTVVTIGAALAGLALLFAGHKYKVGKAHREGKSTGKEIERERIAAKTTEKTVVIKEKAKDIKRQIEDDTEELSELRKKMLASATDHNKN